MAGLAAMSVPIGTSDGLPVGLQLMSAPGDDAALYRVGAAVARPQQAIGFHQ